MIDVFLMGTAGRLNDPNRSNWREPIKEACAKVGIACFDPVVPVWTEERGKIEVAALQQARVVVMAITPDTAGVGSLSESGWAVLSAFLRKQAVGIYVDPEYNGERVKQSTFSIQRSELINDGTESIGDASRRARKLVNSHARNLTSQFPNLNLFVAQNLQELTAWTVSTAQKLRHQAT